MPELFIPDLVLWFQTKGRSLPWRVNPTPYSVWISEVMLQQTQVSRVLLYFKRWIALFPTIQALAESSEEMVMKAWEGLGYYSRARALRQGAKYIQEKYHGVIPSDRAALLSIPGIGEYTQGAIRSFAFHEKAAAVDANVLRVISRLYDLPLEQGSLSAYNYVRVLVDKFLPEKKPWVTMEALIELGALVCGKKAECEKCCLKKKCLSFQNNTIQERPLPKKPMRRIYEKRIVFVFQRKEMVCVVKRQGKGVMSGLWEFPYCLYNEQALEPLQSASLSLVLETIQQSFTNYSVTLYPHIFHVPDTFFWHEGEWVEKEKLHSLAFSSGHKKIVERIADLI